MNTHTKKKKAFTPVNTPKPLVLKISWTNTYTHKKKKKNWYTGGTIVY